MEQLQSYAWEMEGKTRMQYLTLTPLDKKISFGKNQMKPYSAAHKENIHRY